MNRTKVITRNLAVASFLFLLPSLFAADAGPRLIEITATKDARFVIKGQKDPVITVKPGEVVHLKITAQKGPEFEKDGTVHSFTIKEFKDQGWDLRLKEGLNEATLVAPDKPGEYVIECTVKCDPKHHDDMKAKLIVKP
jgi:heme/copper-type cytochrome/quinol oxidase subunit 2